MKKWGYSSFVLIFLVATVSSITLPAVLSADKAHAAAISSSKIDAFKAAVTASGFTVKQLTYARVDPASLVCRGIIQSAYGNNAGGNYLSITDSQTGLPAPYEFQLGPGDAIVFIGYTPPPVAYFSYRSYLFSRQYEGDAGRTTLFASLGDTLNNLTIHTEETAYATIGDTLYNLMLKTGLTPSKFRERLQSVPGSRLETANINFANPYNQPIFIVSTADNGVDAQMRDLAMGAGFSPDIMNTDVIPSSVVRLGIGPQYDSFIFLNRITLPLYGHSQDLTNYMANPNMTVLYISQAGQTATADPFPTPIQHVRGTGLTEADLMPSVEALRQSIFNKYPGYTATEMTTQVWLNEWLDGIQRKQNLLGETRDTSYLRTAESFTLPANDPDAFLIIYGVNHQATGKATYSSGVIYQEDKELGICAVDSPVFTGSAYAYVPDNENAQYLYAWKVARDCGGDAKCLQIKLPGALENNCPNVDLGSDLFVAFRAYLEPETAVGPSPSELLYDRVILFKKASTVN